MWPQCSFSDSTKPRWAGERWVWAQWGVQTKHQVDQMRLKTESMQRWTSHHSLYPLNLNIWRFACPKENWKIFADCIRAVNKHNDLAAKLTQVTWRENSLCVWSFILVISVISEQKRGLKLAYPQRCRVYISDDRSLSQTILLQCSLKTRDRCWWVFGLVRNGF